MDQFLFKNPDVAKAFIPVGVEADFKIRVPQANWPKQGDLGMFSEITVAVAEQLIAENYNRIAPKDAEKKK